MVIKCRDTGEQVCSYSEYLKTRHWKNVKYLALQRAKGRCKICKCDLHHNFVGHHDSTGAYRRIGRERIGHWLLPDDVIAVCNYCHNTKNHELLHWDIKVPVWAKKEEKEAQ